MYLYGTTHSKVLCVSEGIIISANLSKYGVLFIQFITSPQGKKEL